MRGTKAKLGLLSVVIYLHLDEKWLTEDIVTLAINTVDMATAGLPLC